MKKSKNLHHWSTTLVLSRIINIEKTRSVSVPDAAM